MPSGPNPSNIGGGEVSVLEFVETLFESSIRK
jgi:hypothetical protein